MNKLACEQNPELILIAEDDAGDQALIRRAFDRIGFGKTLAMAANGEEVLDYLLRRESYRSLQGQPLPDMLILDLNMPRMDGLQVLDVMSRDQTLRKVPVIVFSTADQQKDIQQSYRQGAWFYLIKPDKASDYARVAEDMKTFWRRHCPRAFTPIDAMTVMGK